MCSKCVLTVPLTTINPDLQTNMEKVNGVIRGTIGSKCVLTFPLTIIDLDLQTNMERVKWCYQRNDVYKICIDRSSYYYRSRSSNEHGKS